MAVGCVGSDPDLSLLHTGLARWYLHEVRDSTEQLFCHGSDTGATGSERDPTQPAEGLCHCDALLSHPTPIPAPAQARHPQADQGRHSCLFPDTTSLPEPGCWEQDTHSICPDLGQPGHISGASLAPSNPT
jgi:hypothetical protein